MVFGLWLGLSKMEWMICFVLFGQVISLELSEHGTGGSGGSGHAGVEATGGKGEGRSRRDGFWFQQFLLP